MKVLKYILATLIGSMAVATDIIFVFGMYLFAAVNFMLSMATDLLSPEVHKQQHETEMWLLVKSLGWIFKIVDVDDVAKIFKD